VVKLSERTTKLLKEDILSILYERPLIALSTYKISRELRRDNEFTKILLLEMQKEGFIEEVKKGVYGEYVARRKWKIPSTILKAMQER